MSISIKERLFSNWSVRRVMYLTVGSICIAQGVYQQEWIPALLGSYFAIMGILGLGCAATGCCNIPPPAKDK